MGIYKLTTLKCGCKIKSYTGGNIFKEGCPRHKSRHYKKCPVCGIKIKKNVSLNAHRWTHAI